MIGEVIPEVGLDLALVAQSLLCLHAEALVAVLSVELNAITLVLSAELAEICRVMLHEPEAFRGLDEIELLDTHVLVCFSILRRRLLAKGSAVSIFYGALRRDIPLSFRVELSPTHFHESL
jgi:hypothetical protein